MHIPLIIIIIIIINIINKLDLYSAYNEKQTQSAVQLLHILNLTWLNLAWTQTKHMGFQISFESVDIYRPIYAVNNAKQYPN